MSGKTLFKTVVMILALTSLIIAFAPFSSGSNDETKPELVTPPQYVVIEESTLQGEVEANGLKLNTDYVLSLNGKEGRPGNEQLKKFGEYDGEGYYDFIPVRSDDNGYLKEPFTLNDLPNGKYDIKFLIKELPDYDTVIAYDFMKFEIKRGMDWLVILTIIGIVITIIGTILARRGYLRRR